MWSVVLEAVEVDALLLVYAVHLKLGYRANFALIEEYLFVEKYSSYSNSFDTIVLDQFLLSLYLLRISCFNRQ